MNKIDQLKSALLFLNVQELREIAETLNLSEKGNKKNIILRICHFLETGEKLVTPKFPNKSCSQKGKIYPISEDGLMLKGAYKNDLKNREFFKKIIGNHFHFTAFGIDWLNERWLQANPPTYLEFAKMWKEEHEKRKITPALPKEEWAYINFVQKYQQENPSATRTSINESWKKERDKQKAKALKLLNLEIRNLNKC